MKKTYYVNDKIQLSGFHLEPVSSEALSVGCVKDGSAIFEQAFVTIEDGKLRAVRSIASANEEIEFYEPSSETLPINDYQEFDEIVDYPAVLRRVKEEQSHYTGYRHEDNDHRPNVNLFVADKSVRDLIERLPTAQLVSEETVARVDSIIKKANNLALPVDISKLQNLTGRSAFEDFAIQYQELGMEDDMEIEMGG